MQSLASEQHKLETSQPKRPYVLASFASEATAKSIKDLKRRDTDEMYNYAVCHPSVLRVEQRL